MPVPRAYFLFPVNCLNETYGTFEDICGDTDISKACTSLAVHRSVDASEIQERGL